MIVKSAAGVISGLSPGAVKVGEDLYTTHVPNGITDIIIVIIIIIIIINKLTYNFAGMVTSGLRSDVYGLKSAYVALGYVFV
jgi:hypothetical protein